MAIPMPIAPDLSDFCEEAKQGVLVSKEFIKAVEERAVRVWPIRGAQVGGQKITMALYTATYDVPADANIDAVALQAQ